MKVLLQQNPLQARQIMVNNPQLTKALFQVLALSTCLIDHIIASLWIQPPTSENTYVCCTFALNCLFCMFWTS